MIDFSKCGNSICTKEVISNRLKEFKLKDIQEHIAKKFYNANDIVEFLFVTIKSGENGILYGPGGFGKSQITKEFLEYVGIPAATKVGHSSMDVEALLGIPNIKKLTEESKYEVAFENSIFNHNRVLILEEFLDVRPSVAASLKDIITEGGLRDGNRFIPSKIGSIIICSNKTPDEVSTDLSTAAFYKERFPYSMYVAWDSYSYKDYLNMLDIVVGDSNKENKEIVAKICAMSCSDDKVISPRIALKAFDLFTDTNNLNIFKLISDIDYGKIEDVIAEVRKDKVVGMLSDKISNLNRYLSMFSVLDTNNAIIAKSLYSNISSMVSNIDINDDKLLSNIASLLSILEILNDESDQLLYKEGSNKINLLKDIGNEYKDIQDAIKDIKSL